MDFTQLTYSSLLETLQSKYRNFFTFRYYIQQNISLLITHHSSLIFLRHDVDRNPKNALKMAELEHSVGITSSYYFRIVPESYNLQIMTKIAKLGHEIGYHYEDVDFAYQKLKFKFKQDKNLLIRIAYESFCKNLEMLRKNFDIKTICMHGSPHSKYDNKIIWEKYNYKELGIIGEPYIDINFNQFAYFTDTGRRWNGHKFSIRDKVNSKYKFNYISTKDIIDNIDKLPQKIMFNIHPERWNDNLISWTKEIVWQNVKNILKAMIVLCKK